METLNNQEHTMLKFAWEFLRRNPDYIEEWKKSQNNNQKEHHLKQDLMANRWGLLTYCNPKENELNCITWDCQRFGRAVHFVDFENTNNESDLNTSLDLKNFNRSEKKILNISKNNTIISITKNGEMIHLYGEKIERLIDKKGVVLISPNLSNKQIENIRHLLLVLLDKSLPQKKKLNEYIIILDLLLSGVSQKKIAHIIYGEKKVSENWDQDSWIRAKVRYKIQKAKQYMNKRYFELLS